LKTAKLIMTKF